MQSALRSLRGPPSLGRSAQEADQQGAIQLLASEPYGLVSLWLLGIGFVGYALWRLSETAFGVVGGGDGAGPRLSGTSWGSSPKMTLNSLKASTLSTK